MSIQNQTSIENQNVVGVDIGDGKSYDNSPMPNHRNVAKAYSASTDSTVTMEAATTIPPVSNQQQQQQQLQQQQQHKKETSPPNPSHSQKVCLIIMQCWTSKKIIFSSRLYVPGI
jgi:hypothetical protein